VPIFPADIVFFKIFQKSFFSFLHFGKGIVHIGVVCVVSLTPPSCQAFTTWQIILAEKF